MQTTLAKIAATYAGLMMAAHARRWPPGGYENGRDLGLCPSFAASGSDPRLAHSVDLDGGYCNAFRSCRRCLHAKNRALRYPNSKFTPNE